MIVKKGDIEYQIASEYNYYQKDVQNIINALITIIRDNVACGKTVQLRGLGTFCPGTRKWKGKIYPIVKFFSTKGFKQQMRQVQETQEAAFSNNEEK